MKKYIILPLFLIWAGVVIAGNTDVVMRGSGNALPSTANAVTLFSATSTTGASANTFTFSGISPTKFTCAAIASGVTPTSATVSLDGSIDNSTWITLGTTSAFTTSATLTVSTTPVSYIRGNLATLSTSSTTGSKVSFSCVAAQ